MLECFLPLTFQVLLYNHQLDLNKNIKKKWSKAYFLLHFFNKNYSTLYY